MSRLSNILKVSVLTLSVLTVTKSFAQSTSPVLQSQINMPFGVAGLDANGYLSSPSKGAIDSATVNGQPLSYIIPQIQKIAGGSGGSYIPLSAINSNNGVLGLDSTGNVSKDLVFKGSFAFSPRKYAQLPTSPFAGLIFYCSDCYSVLRDGTSTDTGIPVYFNGTYWTDALGNAIQQSANSSTTAVTPITAAVNESLVATGSSQTDALSLNALTNIVTTVTQGSGVALPNVPIGTTIRVFNRATNTLAVYPEATTSAIESYSAGVSFGLAVNSSVSFIKTSATQWRLF